MATCGARAAARADAAHRYARAVGFRAIGDASVDEAEPDLIPLQRNLILFFLLWLTATSWAVLVWESDANMGMTMVSPIMGLRALLFLAIWVIMMVAMMLPTTAPMILTFHNVHARNRSLEYGVTSGADDQSGPLSGRVDRATSDAFGLPAYRGLA